ncbi:neuropeptide Y receptor type 2-like [Lingula anatina]|uniref:Neuropeptide Y receptor type 2-like n=1 Tax=Lingula anatina TaxID=7574 RepID=A0A1S3JTJ7_LINAN|nr:neuropeptide Y receptor type 2-like [Lingula anatina]|eukprot:XP_013413690.1 neuropeptide Y receptor type 2-like [Lingula anatina]
MYNSSDGSAAHGLTVGWRVTGATFGILSFVNGFLGNILILGVLVKDKVINVKGKASLISLSVCGLCFTLFLLVAIIDTYVNDRWQYGEVLCHVFTFVNLSLFGCSMLQQALIALQRYTCVIFNNKKLIECPKLLTMNIAFCWVIPPLSMIPSMYEEFKEYHIDSLGTDCIFLSDTEDFQKILSFILFIVIPSITIYACYIRIFMVIKKSGNSVVPHDPYAVHVAPPQSAFIQNREIKLCRMFCVMCAITILGYAPFAFLRALDLAFVVDRGIYVICTALYNIALTSNALIYCLMNKNFSQALRRFWCGSPVTTSNGVTNTN